ncbi:cytochrome c oxidase subunit II [candidate division KSB1 bacterium]
MGTDTTGTFWMLSQASTMSGEVDAIFYFIYYVAVFFFLLIVSSIVFFAIRYRRRGAPGLTSGVDHNIKLEIAWTAIPSIILLIIFIWGFQGFIRFNVAPKDALEIKVTGQRWFWSFDYPNGANVQNELVVPSGIPVKLLMSSRDYIHSFFIPEFRTKMDVLPNRYTVTWFEAVRQGTFDLFCAEYCGTQHSSMTGVVRVASETEFNRWLEEQTAFDETVPPEERGESLFRRKQCYTCHSTDGSPNQGPTFQKLFGKQERLTDGSSVTVDENYIRESILVPAAKVVAGYQNIMTTYQGLLSDRELDDLIAFIKSLQ